MKFYDINPNSDFASIAESIGTTVAGVSIMREKTKLKFILIDGIKAAGANILKQDALSVGADLATHKSTILGGEAKGRALLIASPQQLKLLCQKAKQQDFGLKNLAKFINSLPELSLYKTPQIMGVVNINSDSFNPASRALGVSEAMAKIEFMIENGASYIDVGAVSSRPGSSYVGSAEEMRRLAPLLDEIYRSGIYLKAKFSLDSFDTNCLRYGLECGFKMINDITANTQLASLAAEFDAELCIMHMQGEPKNMQDAPHYEDLLGQIYDFLASKAEAAKAAGVSKIVLDVGICFGKTAEQNILLIKHLGHFTRLGYPLLVGASRKSMINAFYKSDVSQRLAGSLFLHQKAVENGASIVRTHDVAEHSQLFALNQAYENLNLW